jgi:DUF4097 and DUF4098 domain-containing protein YvlB
MTARTRAARRSRFALCTAALAACLAQAAAAQTTRINETHALRPDASVDLGVVSHTITVTGWDRNEIQITGEYDADVEELDVGGTDALYHFRVVQRSRFGFRGRRGAQPLEVRLPKGARLTVNTVSGSLTVTGVSGTLNAKSVSGEVTAEGNLGSAILGAVSGSIRYVGNAPTVRLKAVSGEIEYEGSAREVRLEAVSGDIRIGGSAEDIDAKTVSGTIRLVSSGPVQALEASSVSGSVRFEGRLARTARVDVESHSGTVDMRIGPGSDARFELSTHSGSLTARLAGMKDEVKSDSRGPGDEVSFVVGSGSGRVSVTSFSGTVRVTDLP